MQDQKQPNNKDNKKLWFVTVSCWAPMSGTMPIEAETAEDAEKIVREQLIPAKDIVIHDVADEYPEVDIGNIENKVLN